MYSNEKELLTMMNEFINSVLGDKNDKPIDQTELDRFFSVVSNCFLVCHTQGLAALDYKNVNLENECTRKYFIFGFGCVLKGIDSLALKISLSYLTTVINSNNSISRQELFEIKLLEKLILLIQYDNVKDYLFIVMQLCSSNTYNEIKQNFDNLKLIDL